MNNILKSKRISGIHTYVRLALTSFNYSFSFVSERAVTVIPTVITVVMTTKFVCCYIVVFQTRNCLVYDKYRIKMDIHNKFTASYVLFLPWRDGLITSSRHALLGLPVVITR
jgi:hypothetical protein